MSVSLTLMPLEKCGEFENYSHTLLPLEYVGEDLYDKLKEQKEEPNIIKYMGYLVEGKFSHQIVGLIDKAISCYMAPRKDGEDGYGDVFIDKYGQRLMWVSADALGKILEVRKDSIKDVAAVAYLKALPAETKVVMYWH